MKKDMSDIENLFLAEVEAHFDEFGEEDFIFDDSNMMCCCKQDLLHNESLKF
jgi:hypothetical protein